MKSGLLAAYLSAATNLSLYLSAILTVVATLLGRVANLVRRYSGAV